MARRREDVDWYVEMSEMLERRERRRKWIILGIFVAVPLLLMVAGSLAIWLNSMGKLDAWFGFVRSKVSRSDAPSPVVTFDPVTVKSFQEGDIIYSQVDRNGLVTSISHFFRELRPGADSADQAEKDFTVNRTEEEAGKIEFYRLRNVGTGEIFDFKDIPARRVGTAGWNITEEGQLELKKVLEARMKVQLARISKS